MAVAKQPGFAIVLAFAIELRNNYGKPYTKFLSECG